MKKIHLLFTALIMGTALFAQDETPDKINYGNRIDKGIVLLTGGISYNKAKNDNSTFNLQIGPQFALSKHFSLNLGFEYQIEKTLYNYSGSSNEVKTNLFGIIPGATVFANVHFGWLQPYLEIGIPIGFLSDNNDNHATIIGGGLIPGLNVYLSRRLAFSASIGLLQYSTIKYKDSDERDDSIDLGFTPNDITLGIVWVLGGD